jgi:hypothetical protein
MPEYVGDEKPSLEDLMQYGVLGMKWGKTRAKAGPHQIRAARSRVFTQKQNLGAAKEKAAGISDPVKRAKAQQQVGKMKADFLQNPDRAIASRLTRGEKAVAIILLTPAGAAAVIGGTSARSRAIERKQDKRAGR